MPTINAWKIASLLLIAGTPACAIGTTLGRSTRALEHTAQAMDRTRDVLQQSQRSMAALRSSLGALSNLQALEKPLQNLGGLGAGVERLGSRMQGVETNLQRLDEPLANVAALAGPLDRIHSLDKPLTTIANFERHTDKLGPALLGILAMWLIMTFLAVYGAFVAALRRHPQKRRRLRLRQK